MKKKINTNNNVLIINPRYNGYERRHCAEYRCHSFNTKRHQTLLLFQARATACGAPAAS